MPEHYARLAKEEPPHVVVCDYVAGMTDHFLLRQCHELLGTPYHVHHARSVSPEQERHCPLRIKLRIFHRWLP